jgi:CheY-like chemotaxis protein
MQHIRVRATSHCLKLLHIPSTSYDRRTDWKMPDKDGGMMFTVAAALTRGSKRTMVDWMATSGGLTRRILVVDDEPLVCDSVRRMLAVDGHQVETVATGEAALTLFQKDSFDLIIVDYEMPGMNGDELAAAIKALNPNQPILMITAYPETLASSGNPLVGVELLLSKPFDLQELRDAVSKLLPKP